jgi:hypothetical protein
MWARRGHNSSMRTTISTALLALASWFTALAVLTYAAEPSREVLVWVPNARLAKTLSSAPVSVLDGQSAGFLRVRGDTPGFVRSLYAGGAWVVLPAGSGGCRALFSGYEARKRLPS